MDKLHRNLVPELLEYAGPSFGALASVNRQFWAASHDPDLILRVYQRLIGEPGALDLVQMRRSLIELQSVPRLMQLRPRLHQLTVKAYDTEIHGPYVVAFVAYNRLRILDLRDRKWHSLGPWKMKSPLKGYKIQRIKQVDLTPDKRLRLYVRFGGAYRLKLHASGVVDFARYRRMRWVVLAGGAPILHLGVKHSSVGLVYRDLDRLIAPQGGMPIRDITSWKVRGAIVAACGGRDGGTVRVWDLQQGVRVYSGKPAGVTKELKDLQIEAIGPGSQIVLSAYKKSSRTPFQLLVWDYKKKYTQLFQSGRDWWNPAGILTIDGVVALPNRREVVLGSSATMLFCSDGRQLTILESGIEPASIPLESLIKVPEGQQVCVTGASFFGGRLVCTGRVPHQAVRTISIADFRQRS